jgi:crotonobetainyl-CoA:carnitine CoA-transferase CaiB-like acyl-CoA transferase
VLCDVLGAPELAAEDRFATNAQRVAHRRALRSALEQRLAAGSARDWADRLIAARVPAGEVHDIAAAFALAKRIGLDPIVPVEREDGSKVPLPRNPIALSATPSTYDTAPPELPAQSDPGAARWRPRPNSGGR